MATVGSALPKAICTAGSKPPAFKKIEVSIVAREEFWQPPHQFRKRLQLIPRYIFHPVPVGTVNVSDFAFHPCEE
jgi:hypothetical protein